MQNDKYLPPQQAPPGSYPAPGYPPQGYPAQNYQPPPQHYGPPPTQNYVPPPMQQVPPVNIVVSSDGWCQRNQRNKPQSNAVSGASLVFVSGGMNIAYSIGFRSFLYLGLPRHTCMAWFIGAIIGAFIGCFVSKMVPKKILTLCCGLLVTIGGILMAATHHNVEAIEAGLYLDGIANGLAFAPFIALAGEISVPYLRGSLTSSIDQLCFMTGFMIQVLYTTAWNTTTTYSTSFGAQQMHGVLSAFYGGIAMLLGVFLTIESPVVLLAKGEEQEAIDKLRRLQKPYAITTETYAQLEEHKRYLAHNQNMSFNESIMAGLPAFIRIVYLRVLNAMSLSNFVFFTLWISIIPNFTINDVAWQFMVFAFCRWIGNFFGTCLMEKPGRKMQTLFGLAVAGGLAIGIGFIFYEGSLDSVFALLAVFEVFAGIAFASSSTYMSEAFPLSSKHHFISLTFIIEMLVFIIMLACDYTLSGGKNYFIVLGVLYLLGFLMGIFVLPETRRTTLREAQIKFEGILSKGFN